MFVWIYQNGWIVQFLGDDQNEAHDVGYFADLFPEAIYFYAELCAW